MFLKNCWYGAIWSKDLGDEPVARTLLNEKVALFRLGDGTPAALEDRCCHRAAPLSLGTVAGDALECGYHGLRYGADGVCVHVPVQTNIPPDARVRAYPVRERWNMVWIWMGDPDRADEAAIPEMPWLTEGSGWASAPGYFHLKGNYLLIVDNLLDLTHVTYVHRNTIAGDPAEGTVPLKVERLDNAVKVGRWMIDFPPPPLFKEMGGFTTNIDRWQHVTWEPPANVYLDIGCATTGTGAPEGDRSQGISLWSTHMVTPETDTTTHYHWCYSRDFKQDEPEMTRRMYEGSRDTFLEDVDFIEAQQDRLGGVTMDGLVDIVSDNAQLQMRRMLDDMIRAENGAG